MTEATIQLLNGVEIRKSYDAEIPSEELMKSIHMISGVELTDMCLSLRFGTGSTHETVVKQGMDTQPLRGQSECYIVVTDTNPDSLANQLLHGQASDGAEFQYTDREYENRDGTVLKWKQKERLGRFDPQYRSKMESDQQMQKGALGDMTIGERCAITAPGKPERRGWLRYVGPVDTLTGVWCGVEFDTPSGKNNGSFKDKVYFGPVRKDHGGFIRPNQVVTGTQYSPLETKSVLEDTDEL